MSQSDSNSDRSAEAKADLAAALRQLESLLDSQTGSDKTPPQESLPVLDDVVDPEDDSLEYNLQYGSAKLHADAPEPLDPQSAQTETVSASPDPARIRELLDRLAEQMEVELETVVGMLKHSILQDFKSDLATALNLDPQQLDTDSNDPDNNAGSS